MMYGLYEYLTGRLRCVCGTEGFGESPSNVSIDQQQVSGEDMFTDRSLWGESAEECSLFSPLH